MTISIDAGHIRAARGHQGRTFEVMAAQVSNDDGCDSAWKKDPV
jgi:hypothetical protein